LLDTLDAALTYEPDLVIYALVLNDAVRPESFRGRQSYVNDWILERGRPVEEERPPNAWRPRAFDFVEDRIAAWRVGRETERWYAQMWDERGILRGGPSPGRPSPRQIAVAARMGRDSSSHPGPYSFASRTAIPSRGRTPPLHGPASPEGLRITTCWLPFAAGRQPGFSCTQWTTTPTNWPTGSRRRRSSILRSGCSCSTDAISLGSRRRVVSSDAMKMPARPGLLALTALALTAAQATAQTIQIAPMAGYPTGGGLAAAFDGKRYSLASTTTYGGAVDLRISPSWRLELAYSRNPTQLRGPSSPTGRHRRALVRGLSGRARGGGQRRYRWFGTLLLGATRLVPNFEADPEVRFAGGFAIGVKGFLSKNVGFRIEAAAS